MGGSLKNPIFSVGDSQKANIGRLGQFADLRWAWKKEGVGCFDAVGVDTPMHTMLTGTKLINPGFLV